MKFNNIIGKKLAVAVLSMGIFASANSYAGELTGKGVLLGMNIANLNGFAQALSLGDNKTIPPKDSKASLGFVGGGFLTYSLTEQFALQPEFLFTMKGAEYEYEVKDNNGVITDRATGTIDLKYLEIPILAKYTPSGNKNIKPNLFAGYTIGLKVSSDAKLKISKAEKQDVNKTEDLSDDGIAKTLDFGLAFGGGVNIANIAPGEISVQLRYGLGLTTIYPNSTITHGVWGLLVGYSF